MHCLFCLFIETSEVLLQQLLSFAVVGGGPTGVEFTGGLSDFIQEELLVLFPNLKVCYPLPSPFPLSADHQSLMQSLHLLRVLLLMQMNRSHIFLF